MDQFKQKLESILDHLNNRDSISDLVDDKNQQEIKDLQDIRELCKKISDRMDKICENL